MELVFVRYAAQVLRVEIEACSESVQSLKDKLQQQTGLAEQSQKLVFCGRILDKQDSVLLELGVSAGSCLYLSKNKSVDIQGSPSEEALAKQHLGKRTVKDVEEERQHQARLKGNLTKPLIQMLKSNPEMMKGLLANTPEMKALLESNPEMHDALDDPALLEQMFSAMENPELEKEALRNTDMAINNLEAMPNGFGALRHLYETLLEPLFDNSTKEDEETREEAPTNKRGPMPNPWARESKGILDPELYESVTEDEEEAEGVVADYEQEINTLVEMGFSDYNENLAALVQAKGNITEAISLLVQSRGQKK